MKCPHCQTDNDRVIDSRASEDGFAIRRRRECLACQQRFTTYERVEAPMKVVKKDGSRVPYDRAKLKLGRDLGELLMRMLREVDQVAYVRFASVYRQFEDVHDFVDELKAISAESGRPPR